MEYYYNLPPRAASFFCSFITLFITVPETGPKQPEKRKDLRAVPNLGTARKLALQLMALVRVARVELTAS